MGEIKWYKRDPDAALSGMMGLNLEERGAYNTVLDLIYTRDGNLPDDDRFISGWMGVDLRVWRRIKTRLVTLGKLYLDGGLIRNRRADVEVLNALSRVGSAREAGKASAAAKARKLEPKSQNSAGYSSTVVDRGVEAPVSTTHNHNQKKEEEPNGSPSSASAPEPAPAEPVKRGKAKRTTGVDRPLPDDWEPALTAAAQAIVDLWPPGMLDRELFKFRGHAVANGRLAKDWDAAFRTWIGNSDERLNQGGHRNGQAHWGGAAIRPDKRDRVTRILHEAVGLDLYPEPTRPAGRSDDGELGGGRFLAAPKA